MNLLFYFIVWQECDVYWKRETIAQSAILFICNISYIFFSNFLSCKHFFYIFHCDKKERWLQFFFFMPYHVTINALPTGAVIKSDRIHFEKFSDLLYASLPCHKWYRAGAVFCFLLYILVARTLPVFVFRSCCHANHVEGQRIVVIGEFTEDIVNAICLLRCFMLPFTVFFMKKIFF